MAKCFRHPSGFYKSLFNDDRDLGSLHAKYQPKEKPSVMGVYEVKRIVAKRIQKRKTEYFIQWKNYSPSENTWEPAEHLPQELIAAFNFRDVDPLCLDECRERLALVFEKGLRSPLGFSDTITMRHDVLRVIFPKMPTDLRTTPYFADEEDLVRAGLSPFIKKCLTVTGGGCLVNTPVKLKLFLGKSPAFLDEQGRRTPSRPVEKVQVQFTNTYFTGNMQ